MSGADFDGRFVDHVLGEGDEATREAVERDLGLAVETAELRMLFEDLRSLSVEPSGAVELAVRHAIDRRLQLRGEPSPRRRVLRAAQVALVAAAALAVFVLVDRTAREATRRGAPTPLETLAFGRSPDQSDEELGRLLDHQSSPVADPEFLDCLARFEALPLPDSFNGWITASHDLAALSARYQLCFAPDERRAVLRAIGAPNLEDRLESLARTVAYRVDRGLAEGTVDTDELSIALRAMLASGSSRTHGPHRRVVDASARELERRLPELEDSEVASAVAALSELAVLEGGHLLEVVGVHTERLARATLTPGGAARPGLLHWRTPVARLADAGRLLRIAPAFGVHAGLSFRARLMVAAHLEERLAARSEIERPSLVAARLYGFGDLIDRDRAEHALMLWSPELRLPDNYVALHHLAWSKRPERPGWASFQQELRGLSGRSTPTSTTDAAALLLSLTMNYAAPDAPDPRSA